jgi:tocopherol O-methyltransferase
MLAGDHAPGVAENPGQAQLVRHYYEGNTRWMLGLGVGRAEGVMHRPVWIDGVRDRRQALRTAERLIAAALALEPLTARPRRQICAHHVLDLGCGAGSSALWLARRFAVSVTGITLSALQARAAAAQASRGGLQDRCRFLFADFLTPLAVAPAQSAYAVEAFSHTASPRCFFRAAAGLLAAHGRLVICDDFLSEPPPGPSPGPPSSGASSPEQARAQQRRARCLARFRRGWRLASLTSLGELEACAASAGFSLESQRDLTPFLRLEPWTRRLPQLALGLALAGTPWGASRLGGAALQQALRAGWVRYLLLVLKKR